LRQHRLFPVVLAITGCVWLVAVQPSVVEAAVSVAVAVAVVPVATVAVVVLATEAISFQN
jgi:hypothetical protein